MAAKRKAPKASTSSAPQFTAEQAAFIAAAVKDGLEIQPRFRPEPLLAKTGRGFMESSGVSEIAAAKKKSRAQHK